MGLKKLHLLGASTMVVRYLGVGRDSSPILLHPISSTGLKAISPVVAIVGVRHFNWCLVVILFTMRVGNPVLRRKVFMCIIMQCLGIMLTGRWLRGLRGKTPTISRRRGFDSHRNHYYIINGISDRG